MRDDELAVSLVLSSAAGIRARSLSRRFWVATVGLGVFAGVAGGAALGVWGIARRTSTVYDRFVTYEAAADFAVFACPAGATLEEINADHEAACGAYDYADVRQFLSTMDGVESVGRLTTGIVQVASAANPKDQPRQLAPIAIDPGSAGMLGTPIIVQGRNADPAAPTELTINEEMARRLAVTIGDDLIITPYRVNQSDVAGEGIQPAGGPPTKMKIVGITRRPADLLGRLGTGTDEGSGVVLLGPGFWEAANGDVANYGVELMVRTSSDVSPDDVMAALRARWPGRPIFPQEGQFASQDGQETVVDAIRLQTVGLYLIAAVVALAALVFAGQAVGRQVRREWADAEILDALGMTRQGMVGAAALRAVGFTVVATAVAWVVATVTSPLGPLGIGKAAETDPGMHIDWRAAAIALPIIAACVFISAVLPVATIRRRPDPNRGRVTRSRVPLLLPPTGIAGRALARSRTASGLTLGSAVIGAALASATGVAAWSLIMSYDNLLVHPARYGSTWDAQVGNVGSPSQQDDTRARLSAIPGIRAVGIQSADGMDRDPTAKVFAAEPFLGEVAFGAMTAGRAPVAATEIALARDTMKRYGVSIGDEVTLTDPFAPENTFHFEVVGEVVANDTLSPRPGHGALVTSEAMSQMADALSQTYVVWIDPGMDRAATLSALRAAFPTTFIERSVPQQVSNLGLVANQPALLAVLVGLLAGVAIVHALATSVRRGRRQIGVLKSIGFTRRQVAATVAWHASTLAGWALIIGIPLGVVIGRVVWTKIINNIGLVSPPSVSLPAIAIVVLVVLATANIAAIGPGLAAARTRAAHALRTE